MKHALLFVLIYVIIVLIGCAHNPYSDLPENQKPKILEFRIDDKPHKPYVFEDEEFTWEIIVNEATDTVEVSFWKILYRDPNRDFIIWGPKRIYVGDEKNGIKSYGEIGESMLCEFRIRAWSKQVPRKHGDKKTKRIEVLLTSTD